MYSFISILCDFTLSSYVFIPCLRVRVHRQRMNMVCQLIRQDFVDFAVTTDQPQAVKFVAALFLRGSKTLPS